MKNDHDLIRQFQNGKQSAFDEIVKRHMQTVYTFFIRVTKDEMEAEDLAQEVFIKLFRALKRFRFEANFNTYLYRVNMNTANTYLQRNRWRNMLHLDQIHEPHEINHDLDIQWSKIDLWNAVAKLPKKQRLVIIMRIAQEMPYKDIANILNTNEGTAKVNYHHGITKLKEMLGEK